MYGDNGGRIGKGLDPMKPISMMFPDAEYRVMSDATHSGPMEHPDVFEAAIREFEARLRKPA
jgi:hypothetical protein